MIIKIEKSHKKNKRFTITMNNNKKYDFGLINGSTYIDHHDKQKRDNYIKRHISNDTEYNLIMNLIPSPSLFSLVILWGPYTSINENINYLNNLWKIKHGDGINEFINENQGIYDYTNDIKNIINENGYTNIIKIIIFRKPINTLLNIPVKMLNNIPYDKYYHLYIVVYLTDGKRYRIEKNERINITSYTSFDKMTQFREILNIPNNLNMKIMLDNCLNQMGYENFYTYHPFNNNCQVFITNLLTSNGININEYNNFINQDVKYINQNYKSVGKLSSKLINSYGTIKSLFN